MDPTTPATKPPRPISNELLIVKLDHDQDFHVDDTLAYTPPPSAAPARPHIALRRKKHLSIYRASAPVHSPVSEVAVEIPSIIRPQSMGSPSTVARDDDLSALSATLPPPTRKPPMHTRAYSQPNSIRLGSPRRPLYSAIRANMSTSRPSSPLGYAATNASRPTSIAAPAPSSLFPRPPSALAYSPPAHAWEDSDVDDADSPVSPVISPRPSSSRFSFRLGFGQLSTPPSSLNSGFSVSGEMEMRMALAALARESRQRDAARGSSAYQFQEAPAGKSPPGSISGRVKKLRQGLKDLVRGKHA